MSELFEKVPKKRTFRELVVKKFGLTKKKIAYNKYTLDS